MDAKEQERIKRLIIEYVDYAKLLESKLGVAIPCFPFTMLNVMYRLDTDSPYPELVQEAGEEGFRLLRAVILLSAALCLSTDHSIIRHVAGAVQKAFETEDTVQHFSDDVDFQTRIRARIKRIDQRAEVFTADLGLPVERVYEVSSHARRIDPKLIGSTPLREQKR